MQLRRSQSMTRRYEFARVREEGVSSVGRFLIVSLLPKSEASEEGSQFGIIVTKKVGNACLRNKLRRRVRVLLREAGDIWAQGHFVVVVIRWRAATASLEDLRGDFLRSQRRLQRGQGTPASGGGRRSS